MAGDAGSCFQALAQKELQQTDLQGCERLRRATWSKSFAQSHAERLTHTEAALRDRREVNLLERIQWRYVAPLFVFLVLLPRKDLASGLETFEQALTRHHIELAKPALIEALRNPDGEVRGPAAWQLLEMKA